MNNQHSWTTVSTRLTKGQTTALNKVIKARQFTGVSECLRSLILKEAEAITNERRRYRQPEPEKAES